MSKKRNPSSVAEEALSLETFERMRAELDEVKSALAAARQGELDWHSRAIEAEQTIEDLKNELMGVLKAITRRVSMVTEELLTYHQLYGTIERALENLRGPRFWLNWRLIGAVVVSLAVVGYFWANPSAAEALRIWMSQTQNQVYTLIALGIIGAIMYFGYRRTRR